MYHGDNNSHPLSSDIVVIDGVFMLYLMKEIPQIYDEISRRFLSIMITQFHANHIDIIFDQYFILSIKDCQRTQFQLDPIKYGHYAQLKTLISKKQLLSFFYPLVY